MSKTTNPTGSGIPSPDPGPITQYPQPDPTTNGGWSSGPSVAPSTTGTPTIHFSGAGHLFMHPTNDGGGQLVLNIINVNMDSTSHVRPRYPDKCLPVYDFEYQGDVQWNPPVGTKRTVLRRNPHATSQISMRHCQLDNVDAKLHDCDSVIMRTCTGIGKGYSTVSIDGKGTVQDCTMPVIDIFKTFNVKLRNSDFSKGYKIFGSCTNDLYVYRTQYWNLSFIADVDDYIPTAEFIETFGCQPPPTPEGQVGPQLPTSENALFLQAGAKGANSVLFRGSGTFAPNTFISTPTSDVNVGPFKFLHDDFAIPAPELQIIQPMVPCGPDLGNIPYVPQFNDSLVIGTIFCHWTALNHSVVSEATGLLIPQFDCFATCSSVDVTWEANPFTQNDCIQIMEIFPNADGSCPYTVGQHAFDVDGVLFAGINGWTELTHTPGGLFNYINYVPDLHPVQLNVFPTGPITGDTCSRCDADPGCLPGYMALSGSGPFTFITVLTPTSNASSIDNAFLEGNLAFFDARSTSLHPPYFAIVHNGIITAISQLTIDNILESSLQAPQDQAAYVAAFGHALASIPPAGTTFACRPEFTPWGVERLL